MTTNNIDLPLMDIPERGQKATWWENDGVDIHGRYKYKSPVQISCRWEDMAVEFVAPDNTKQVSKSVVYPDRALSVGDILLLKETHKVDQPKDPRGNVGYSEIRQFQQIPDYDQTEVLFIAML